MTLVYASLIIVSLFFCAMIYREGERGFALVAFFIWPIFVLGILFMFSFHALHDFVRHLFNDAYFNPSMLEDWSSKSEDPF